MNAIWRGTFLVAISTLQSLPARAAPTVEFVSAFIEASEHARRPGATALDIERFPAYVSVALTEHHVAWKYQTVVLCDAGCATIRLC